MNANLRHALAAFVAALVGQPLVTVLTSSDPIHITRDLVVSSVVAALVAAYHKLNG